MREPKPYELADEAIRRLNRLTTQRLSKSVKRLIIAGFDELNVLKEADLLYTALEADNQAAFTELFRLRFGEMYAFCGGKRIKDDDLDDLVDMYLTGLLADPDPVTRYSYYNEATRKCERCKEAVVATNGIAYKKLEMERAVRLWNQMSQQYCDIVSDAAAVAAMQKAGVKYVRWHTQEDDKVCSDCHELDKKVFQIDLLPDKPHWRCRCWISPVRTKS